MAEHLHMSMMQIGINKSKPNGFRDIWDVFTAIKSAVSTIVTRVTLKVVKKIADMYSKARQAKHRIIVLMKIIYDYYRGVSVYKGKYVML